MMAAPSFPGIPLAPLEGAVPAWRAKVDAAQWRTACETVARTGGRLAALWASEDMVRALLVLHEGLVCLELHATEYPDISDLFACAGRMQRAAFDLAGVRATGALDTRRWLRASLRSCCPFRQVSMMKATLKAIAQYQKHRPAAGFIVTRADFDAVLAVKSEL